MASDLGFVTEEESADLGFKADEGDLGFVEESTPHPSLLSRAANTFLGAMGVQGEAMRRNELPKEGVSAVTVPRFGEPGTAMRGVSEGLSALVEGTTTPEAIATMGIVPVPGAGKVLGPLFGAALAKGVSQLAGEASVTGNPETIAEAATIAAAPLIAHGVVKALAETPEVPVAHEALQPMATEAFKAVVEGAKTSEAPKVAEGEFQAAEKEALGASAGAQPKEPSASSQQVSTEVGGTVLRVGEVPRSETSGLPVNEGGEGVRGNENQGVTTARSAEETLSRLDPKDPLVKQAVETYASKGAGVDPRTRKTFGLDKTQRGVTGRKLWENMTPDERYAEFENYAKKDFEALNSIDPAKRDDYMLDRALDFLDPMSGVYKLLLKQRGYEIEGGIIRAPSKAIENQWPSVAGTEAQAEIGPPGELKPTKPVEPTLPAESQGHKPPELTSETEPTDFEASLRATIHSTFTRDEPTVANAAVDVPRIQSSPVTTPSTPESRPLGIVAPSSASFLGARFDAYRDLFAKAKSELSWKTFAQETLPKWTEAEREVGEVGAEYAAAPMVGEAMGLKFARDAMGEHAGDPVFDRKLGTAIKEDNLRSIRDGYEKKADEARRAADAAPNARESYLEDAALYDKAAQAVVTLIGAKNSPFRTEAEYRAFLRDADTVAALDRYKQLWAEQKEPLFREAAGIDPEVELAGRGLETGARINLTFEREGEAKGKGITGQAAVGAQVRQLGTLLRRDPFLRQATGTGTSYHASLSETMADAFRREYPVAAQHKFIRLALERGVAQVGTKFKAPEGFKSYVLKLNPWQGKQLYVPNRLVPEYEALTGLSPGFQIPFVTPTAAVLTRQSILGLGEGSAHSANILLKLFTGITSEHPWREAFLSALPGRPDAIGAVARALMRGLRPDNAALLELAKINAAKRPYSGPIAAHILNPLDRGVRLLSADVFKGLAEAGIVKDTPTNLREFVNEVGNYTQSVQSPLVRNLRSMQVQPFATGFRTAKVQVAKRLALAPGLEATTTMNAVALRAAILGKFIGAATTIATLNYILNGSARGLPGTKLGAVSWQGKDGRTRQFDLGAFLGATAGARALGIAQVIEAKERGLGGTTAAAQGARGIATTLTSQLAGPSVRFATVALTGKDPYGMQVAPMSPQGSDPVKNIMAALQGANPIVDVASRIHAGQPWSDVWQRQLTRYSPSTPSSLSTSGKFAKVVTNKNLMEYADWVASQARKLDQSERSAFVREQLARDGVVGPQLRAAQTEIKRKGVYKYK